MSAFSFDARTNSVKSYLLFTRYSGYILQARWIRLWSSDMKFHQDSVYQNLLKPVHCHWVILKNQGVIAFLKEGVVRRTIVSTRGEMVAKTEPRNLSPNHVNTSLACITQNTYTSILRPCRLCPMSRYQNQSEFYWSNEQWVAVASAGPYANLHLAPDR